MRYILYLVVIPFLEGFLKGYDLVAISMAYSLLINLIA